MGNVEEGKRAIEGTNKEPNIGNTGSEDSRTTNTERKARRSERRKRNIERTESPEAEGFTKISDGKTERISPIKKDEEKAETNVPRETKKEEPKKAPRRNIRRRATKGSIELTQSILQTGFGVVAMIPTFEHWVMEDEEAEKIAEPLANVLNKYGMLDKITAHSDLFGLVSGLGVAIAVRTSVTVQLQKELKKETLKIKQQKAVEQSLGVDTNDRKPKRERKTEPNQRGKDGEVKGNTPPPSTTANRENTNAIPNDGKIDTGTAISGEDFHVGI